MHSLEAFMVWTFLWSGTVKLNVAEWKRGMRSGKGETKWNIVLGFVCNQTPMCVCCLTLSDALVTKTVFCRDSVWLMLIGAAVWDLWWTVCFESNKESLWIPAHSTNEACSMLTRWESLANSLNLFQAPFGFQVFFLDQKPKHPGRGSCCHISSPSDKALASKPACCCKIPTLP